MDNQSESLTEIASVNNGGNVDLEDATLYLDAQGHFHLKWHFGCPCCPGSEEESRIFTDRNELTKWVNDQQGDSEMPYATLTELLAKAKLSQVSPSDCAVGSQESEPLASQAPRASGIHR